MILFLAIEKSPVIDVELKDRVLGGCMEWPIRYRNPTSIDIMYHSGTFFTGNPGYRCQLRAQIDRLHGDVYFAVRILKGIFDDVLKWPCQEGFCIKLSEKMKSTMVKEWRILPCKKWKNITGRPLSKNDNIVTEWTGPFDISKFIEAKLLVFEFCLSK